MNLRTFEDLEVWKKGREVRLFVQAIVKKFPSDEKFALTLQIRKSSRSITNNIAELNEFRVLHVDCLRLLNGYISYLQKAKTGSSNQ